MSLSRLTQMFEFVMMPKRFVPRAHTALYILLIVVLVAGGIGAYTLYARADDPPLLVAGSSFGLSGPLRRYWEDTNGAATLGPPRSAALWRDGATTQFFDNALLTTNRWGSVERAALPSNWATHQPAALTTLDAAAQRAEIDVATALAVPLEPLTVTVRIANYNGPAELQIFDAQARPMSTSALTITNGVATLTVLPGGALGTQQALVLVEGRIAGVRSAAFTLDAQTTLRTNQQRFNQLFYLTRSFLSQSTLTYDLDGRSVHGYRSPDSNLLWLRDHTYQSAMARLFDPDVISLIDAFRRAQQPDGSFPDYLARPQLHLPAQRMTVEADVEYLFVQAVYTAWQATGDDSWLRENLPAMRKALRYTMSDPQRWDAERGLVKRPYTIDTWDFEYGPSTTSPQDGQPAPRHWIDNQTRWSIFHGDNTGLAYALTLLADAEERVGDGTTAARAWRADAKAIMQRLNAMSWNGHFFTHQVPLQPFSIPGVDTAAQLSLSNALALNRGNALDDAQAREIIGEYYKRYEQRGTNFAEWYSIDPPFPAGSYGLAGRKGELPGEYVNGGVMPLVGGELARGAFRYDVDSYGFDILARYTNLVSPTQSTYLWYYPVGNPGISGPDTLAHDGWGASAMLGALVEGAGGVADDGARFATATLSPRWSAAADVNDVTLCTRYAASDGYIAYHWQRSAQGITLHVTGSGESWKLRVLLPNKHKPQTVLLNGAAIPIEIEKSPGTRSVVITGGPGVAVVNIDW